jgi:hypothetical protein
MRSSQDSIAPTKRTDAGIGFKYFLPRDWFLAASLNFLSNTEQALQLRSIGKLGGGKFLIHTNKTYWTLAQVFHSTMNGFTNEVADQNSVEGYGGMELNMFDVVILISWVHCSSIRALPNQDAGVLISGSMPSMICSGSSMLKQD